LGIRHGVRRWGQRQTDQALAPKAGDYTPSPTPEEHRGVDAFPGALEFETFELHDGQAVSGQPSAVSWRPDKGKRVAAMFVLFHQRGRFARIVSPGGVYGAGG